MADISNQGLTMDQVLASIPTSFVNNGGYQTVANLLANFPAGAGNLGKYARVSDLWGTVSTVIPGK